MVDPQNVVSPKSRLSGPIAVLKNTGAGGYSVARFKWEGAEAVGIRWNGEEGPHDVGNPQSRGLPTWFILPDEVAEAVVAFVGSSEAAPDVEAELQAHADLESQFEAVAERVFKRLLDQRANE